MASPTRKPEDLRTILLNNQNGDKQTDQSENAMLRSRIEEQGQLICFLKLRADENLNRTKVLEEINEELEILKEQEKEKLKEKEKLCKLLERRFDELSENHVEMIKFKDFYKNNCQELMNENQKLLRENKDLFSESIKEKDDKILELQNELMESGKEIVELKNLLEGVESKLRGVESNCQSKVDKIEKKLKERKVQLELKRNENENLKIKTEETESRSKSEVAGLKKKNQQLVDEVMNRGRLLQERQSEVQVLSETLTRKNKVIQDMEADYKRKLNLADVNIRVQQAENERNIAMNDLKKFQQKHEAYVRHANQLLEQEKDLNLKLRKHDINCFN
nr:coiled-coil domain-containing protein 89-like [Ciona intestinalis]|eukprot:XP_002120901.1 coiled-coil domain-containing protein 89-like [Ciona intestinalis]